MRELSISFDSSGTAVLSSVHNYQDEHNAVCLAITLSNDLLSAEADEYYLSFVRDADADNPMPQKATVGPMSDIREGVLYYELPSSLTNTTCLAVQIDAVKLGSDGSVASLVKSPAFRLAFHPSLQGEEVMPVTQDTDSLIERLLNAASQTLAVKESVAAAFAQGQFHAKINGHDAITLQGGLNLSVTDANGAVTLDCSTLPMVSSLPQNPQNGDVVLWLPQNEITPRESQAELKTCADMLAAVAASERQIMALDPTSRCPIYLNLRKNGSIVGFVSLSSDIEEDDLGQPVHVCIIAFVTKMRRNQPYEGIEITYVDGVFDTDRSCLIQNGTAAALSTVPTAVRLPDFDTVEEVEYEPPTLPAFFAPASLWVYQARWLEVTSVSGPRHFHDNKATIDCFNCDAVEAQANTPAGQPVIALDYTGWDRLRWGGSEVRMVDDGGVVDHVETVTINSKSFLRLWLDYGEVQTIYQGAGTRPSYIDIPIDSATASTVTQSGITLNGTELDFGIGLMSSDITELEEDSHTHTNKAVLDDLGAVYVVPNSAIKAATYETRPINGVRPTEPVLDGYSGVVYAGSPLVFQVPQTQSIVITALTNNANYFYPEYVIEFTTGATAPTLTLPASV
ncbi:MAG: hypothetical protein IJU96_04490, partial [Clostridia bacterium]|nr:hypothetical protein [Clostridia bacterium]